LFGFGFLLFGRCLVSGLFDNRLRLIGGRLRTLFDRFSVLRRNRFRCFGFGFLLFGRWLASGFFDKRFQLTGGRLRTLFDDRSSVLRRSRLHLPGFELLLFPGWGISGFFDKWLQLTPRRLRTFPRFSRRVLLTLHGLDLRFDREHGFSGKILRNWGLPSVLLPQLLCLRLRDVSPAAIGLGLSKLLRDFRS